MKLKRKPLTSNYYLATLWDGKEQNVAVRTPKRFDVELITPKLSGQVDLILSHLSEYEYGFMADTVPSLVISEAVDAADVKRTLKNALKRFYAAP